jgi:hypothetical protein
MSKILFLDALPFNSTIQVGSHKYARLFRKNGFEVFSISRYINAYKFVRRDTADMELIANWKKGVQESSEGIFHYTPFCLVPYINAPLLDQLFFAHHSLRSSIPSIKEILSKMDFCKVDIVFVNNIVLSPILKFINPKLKVLRISDRIESFKNVPKTIKSLEREVIDSVDFVFATSRNLQEEIRQHHENAVYLPNGVDEDFILKDNESLSPPPEYTDSRPVVLYIGAISDWFDYDIYEYGLANFSDVNFVMIGPVEGSSNNVARIREFQAKYPNFQYLGKRKHADLRSYLAHAGVGVIPFDNSPLTNDINPVKFFEYAGFGLPTVASHLKELENYRDQIFFYRTNEEYVSAIQTALSKREELHSQTLWFARNNTWENRFQQMISCLEIKAKS